MQLEEVTIGCPYCGEAQVVSVEPEAHGHRYVEDCQVCCRPIVMEVEHGPQGPPEVTVWRDDD